MGQLQKFKDENFSEFGANSSKAWMHKFIAVKIFSIYLPSQPFLTTLFILSVLNVPHLFADY